MLLDDLAFRLFTIVATFAIAWQYILDEEGRKELNKEIIEYYKRVYQALKEDLQTLFKYIIRRLR